jgi:hypothetical protein
VVFIELLYLCIITSVYNKKKGRKMRSVLCAVALLGFTGLTGCATITTDKMQAVAVSAKDMKGADVQQVACTLENEKGLWSVNAPNTVKVHKAAGNLRVDCKKPGYPDGKLHATSRAGMGMAGNILFGGVIGAAVDHTSGKAYKYPENLPVIMGRAVVIERKNNKAKVVESSTPEQKQVSTDL